MCSLRKEVVDMALIPWQRRYEWDPFRDLLEIQKEMNKLFDSSISRSLDRKSDLLEGFWTPAVDINEEKDKYVIRADLPGLKQEEIDVSVDDDTLTIKGERKIEKHDREKNYYRTERAYGAFQRSFTLPSSVDTDKINATYKDGVLEVTIPKTEEQKKKKVKIDVK
jgi:HSP20 family protein